MTTNVLRLSMDYYNLTFFIQAHELDPAGRGPMRLTMYPGKSDEIGPDDAVQLRRRLDLLAAQDEARVEVSARPFGGTGANMDPETGEPLGAPGLQAE